MAKIHNEEFHIVHSSLYAVTVIKCRRSLWASYVARIGRSEMCCKIVGENCEEYSIFCKRTCIWKDNIV